VSVVTDAQTTELTIDELARRTGMTVRNIRAHQSRGLLPPPEIRGRTGYYGDEHVARLELIAEMQSDGFNLAAIQRLLQDADGATADVLGFKRALMAPFEDEEPEFITAHDLLERFGNDDPKLLQRVVRAGMLVDLGEGRYEIPSPTLWRAGGELIDLGIPIATAVDVLEDINRHARAVSKTFVELFIRQVWRPFDEAGQPEEQWPAVHDALERLRPLATDALLAVFRRTMTRAVERRFGEELERRGGKRR
jgi:DNA-binding transcriptional MerR regulator